MKNLHLHIYGRVQGVGFRYSAKSMARMLGLSGYVKNMTDESVYIEVEGNDPALEEFTRWCHLGPDRADVEYVDIQEGPVKNFTGFETRL